MDGISVLGAQLDVVSELLRTVRPAEAQDRMLLIMRSLSPSDLRTTLPSLEATINQFHKKRRGELLFELHSLLERLRSEERAESLLKQLAELARQTVESIEHTSKASVALVSLAAFENARAKALAEFPNLQDALEVVLLSVQEAIETRLKALFEAQVANLLEQIRCLEASDIGTAPALVSEARKAASDLISAFPLHQPIATDSVSAVKRAAAIKVACGPMLVQLAWRKDLQELVQDQVGAILEQPNCHKSEALAAAVLSDKAVHIAVQRQPQPAGLVQWASDLRRHSEDRPALEGSTRFYDLTEEDIVLASRYSGMNEVQKILEQNGARSLEGLKQQLKDDRKYRTFLVRGLQPRIAELAFARIAPTVVGIEPEAQTDLNLEALRSGQPLPPEDFACAGRRFDVKCNLYFSSYEERRGLRGFQINLAQRSPIAEVAAFVISGASSVDAEWSFVGLAQESGLPANQSRVAPYCFSLPAQLCFQDPWLESHLEQAMAFVDAANDDSGAVGFSASDQFALRRSLSALQLGEPLTERVLWDEVTDGLMRLRGTGGTAAQGAELLNMWQSRANSGYWLLPLASIGGRPLLDRWIDQVLVQLNQNWDVIRCPRCQQAGRIRLAPQRITNGGTVLGAFSCACGAAHPNAAIVTHCWRQGCGRYPLVIGVSPTCTCFGLTCECGACRCNIQRSVEDHEF